MVFLLDSKGAKVQRMQILLNLVDLGESFQTHIYLVLAKFGFDTAENELSFAIKTSAIPRQMFLFSFIFSYPSGTFSF